MATPVEEDENTVESPATPTSLTGALKRRGPVTLNWTAPAGEVTVCEILRRRPMQDESSLTVYVDDTGSTSITYMDNEVAGECHYVYRVRARNSAGPSPQSNFVSMDW